MIDTSMLPDFIVEAAEHLEELENSLLKLEQGGSKEVMDELFRAVHTIKGAAQFVGIERVASLSHKLENLLDLIRKGSQPLTPAVTDLLIEGKDRITQLVEELERGQAEVSQVDDLLARIKRIVEGGSEEEAPPPSAAPPPYEEPRKGTLAEENNEEYDEELYSIFLQQLKENIPFLYAQTVELSISVDKQDVLYRCNDSIKSLKSSANYMGYDKLAKHYTDWQKEINSAIEQLSAGKMPNLSFMQDYIDEIIRSFPQAMEGYSQDEAAQASEQRKQNTDAIGLQQLFEDKPQQDRRGGKGAASDLDDVLDDIFSNKEDEEEESPVTWSSVAGDDDEEDEPEEEEPPQMAAAPPAPAAAAALPERMPPKLVQELSEDGEDEYDSELISIFLKKLQTDIRFLREQAAALPAAADKREVLERCREAVSHLASSANYMEYHSLAAFCREWQKNLEDHAAAVGAGRSPDALGSLHGFMDELLRVYPQAAGNEAMLPKPELASASVSAGAPPAAVAAVTTDFDSAGSTIESFLSPQPLSSAPQPALPVAEIVPERTVSASAAAEKPEEVQQDDSELFARLSNALEQSISSVGDAEEYQMDDVIEGMMDKTSAEEEPEELPLPEPPKQTEKVAPAIVLMEKKAEPAPAPAAAVAPKSEEPPHKEEAAAVAPEAELPSEAPDEEDADAPKQSVVKKMVARSSIRVDAEKIDYLMNQVGELVVSRAYFAQLVNEMRGLQLLLQERAKLSKTELKPLHEFAFRLNEAGVHLGRVSNELQEGVMKIRMLPIDQLFKRYPRLVRDLTHRTDKDIRLVTKGEETELDKMVIESISDPLIHIIRNAVDHGIETITERKRTGKPPQGTLELEAYHESDHIVVEITDDGRGIDPKRIKAKALERGMFSKEELDRMPEDELIRIIMEPGFSTAEKTTETSGRGVGMDVVRKNVERLNGMIEINSKVGKGTQMRIKIPLTMAIIQALMVRVGKEKFTIPLTSVEETLRIFRHDISQIEGVDVIYIRETTMPIFRLAKIYSLDRSLEDEEKMFVVVVSTGTQEVGLVVDELLGQEEVVIKPLADYLRAGSGFGGATILGDGGISLILDIPELVKIAGEDQAEKQVRRTLSFKRKRRRSVEEMQQQAAAAVQ